MRAPTDKQTHPHGQEPSLKGTFAAVMLLGGFIALTWVAVFALYIIRN